jgi:3-oxoadipate enol-lactonase
MLKIQLDGNTLAYERRGRGTPLVLLHGYPLDHTIWAPVAALLEDHFDLILPDLRGFGESGLPAGNYTMADSAADVAGILDHLNIQAAFVAGHSMGGYVALAFAREFPDRTLGLGLVSSQTLADPPEKKKARYQDAGRVIEEGVKDVAETMPAKLTTDAALQTGLKELILRQRPKGLAGALMAMAERPDSTSFLSGFSLPLILVHGLGDELIPVERAEAVKLAAPEARLTEIVNVGHMPMMEAPPITARALEGFL